MRVVVARGEVRARKAPKAQLAAVGSAAHGHAAHLLPHLRVRGPGVLYQVAVLRPRHHVRQVVVLVLDSDGQHFSPAAVRLVHKVHGAPHHVLARLHLRLVVVADDVVGTRLLAVAFHPLQVIEALVALGVLRPLLRGDHRVEPHYGLGRVHHDALCGARVHGGPACTHLCLRGVERLVAELAQGPAVDGVAKACTKLPQVEKGRPVADLLVRDKGNCQPRMGERGVLAKPRKQRHHHRDAGLVVAAQKRRAVARHQIPAHHVLKLRVRGGAYGNLASVAPAPDGKGAAFVAPHLRAHGLPVRLPCGVQVAAQAKRRQPLRARACRPVRRHVGVWRHGHVLGAKLAQVRGHHVCHVQLACRGGHGIRRQGVRLRRHRAVAQEAVENVAHAGSFLSHGCGARPGASCAGRAPPKACGCLATP